MFTFLSWLDLLGVVLTFLGFHSKNLQITSELPTQGYRYHKLRKHLESVSAHTLKDEISIQEFVSEEIPHPVFYGDLVYKLGRVKYEANFVPPGSKIDAFDVESMS